MNTAQQIRHFQIKSHSLGELHRHQQFQQHLKYDLHEDNFQLLVPDQYKWLRQLIEHVVIVHLLRNIRPKFECQAHDMP